MSVGIFLFCICLFAASCQVPYTRIAYYICLLWLTLLSMIISRYVYVAANDVISFFLYYIPLNYILNYIPLYVCMYHIFIHSSADEHLGCSCPGYCIQCHSEHCDACACMHAQSHPTICNPIDHSLPDSSVHGILQARILEWVVMSFCRGSS